MQPLEYDVIVIGGGPAGATVSTLIADGGHRVILLERLPETGFKIGESLMPQTYHTFERLGMLERLRASAFPRKYSVQFYSKSGRASAPFYFQETDPGIDSMTWQIRRQEFDRMMLENAREHGVDVREGAMVRDVLFAGSRAVGVDVELPGEGRRELRARVVVDATGQRALIARKLGLLELDPKLRNAAVFTHFKGAVRDRGIDEGATLVLHTDGQDSWFWYIPLPDDHVSVGVVGPVDYLISGRTGSPQQIFEEEVARCKPLQPRIENAQRVMEFRTLRDFTYRSRQVAGDGWALVGDAFGFMDPIYSSGVLLALSSGELAADAILAALAADDTSAARLGTYGPSFVAGMDSMRCLVHAFYDKNFRFSKFLRSFPEYRLDIIHILRGNVFGRDFSGLFEALDRTMAMPEEADPRTLAESGALAAAPGVPT
ncbi:MAG TPA: NAD(P)/FAD-dependent oxidoreductase [Thermoanaerobaculia bacterium]|nr:NAD(P)/FAD-dependent oxidoreductase [Thermoanaerobaculia bacterium]